MDFLGMTSAIVPYAVLLVDSGNMFGVSLRGFLEDFHTFYTCWWPRIGSARCFGRSEEDILPHF